MWCSNNVLHIGVERLARILKRGEATAPWSMVQLIVEVQQSKLKLTGQLNLMPNNESHPCPIAFE